MAPISSVELKSLNSFAKDVSILTAGEVKFLVVKSNQSIKPFDTLESVSKGTYAAAFGHTHLLSEKESAAILFGSPPLTNTVRFDNTTFFSWFYNAGGSDLYNEMWDKLNLNIHGFILQTSGPRAFGWFRRPVSSLDEIKGMRFRDLFDFTNEIHKEIGLSVVPMKAADILPELDKKKLDGASWCCPVSDLTLGLHESVSNYYLQGISKNILNADLYLNKDVYRKLNLQQRKAIELAASASIIRHSSSLVYENGKALKELLEDHNVILNNTPREYFEEYKKAATVFLSEKSRTNDFFAKVWQSQKDFAIIGQPYWSELHISSKGLYD